MIMLKETFAYSDANRREENQDTCGYMICESAPASPGSLTASVLFVADGVSNSNGGRAAALVTQKIRRPLSNLLLNCEHFVTLPGETPDGQRATAIFGQMQEVIYDLNDVLRRENCSATFSIALILNDYIYSANLGDSPILLLNTSPYQDMELTELYRCHNLAGDMVASGRITKEEALTHDARNQLTVPVLGGNPLPSSIAFFMNGLAQDNLLLMGSDGALSVLGEDTLMDIVEENLNKGLPAINQALLAAVQSTEHGDDNYTLLAQRIFTT